MEKINTIDEYIRTCDPKYQERLFELRKFISNRIPGVEERMSWGMPTFFYKENVIHFALAKHHIGLYPGSEAIVVFKDRLQEYKTSKVTIQIPLAQEIPYALVEDIITFRLKEIEK